jgi:DNA (cytosine-5)-methyltransferase 1
VRTVIPVIDLFAGPGGLGEGFSAYSPENRQNRCFRILQSVERDVWAHRTLELRSFFRQFVREAPEDYYRYLRGEISRNELFDLYPTEASQARQEAMHAELGRDDDRIYARIATRLARCGGRPWVLVGGPPCQAYSVVGRSRRKELAETDERQVLYQQYLKILARFQPHVFVMENVKGLLSSQARLDTSAKPSTSGAQERIFDRILEDITRPLEAVRVVEPEWSPAHTDADRGYRVYSLVVESEGGSDPTPESFVIRSEEYGIPQMRHRVIMLGVRKDVIGCPDMLVRSAVRVSVEDVIEGLPALRSQLSRRTDQERDSPEAWLASLHKIRNAEWLQRPVGTLTPAQLRQLDDTVLQDNGQDVRETICAALNNLRHQVGTGAEFVPCDSPPRYLADWFWDRRLGGVCNHTGRGHMAADLHRYIFLACYAQRRGYSPTMWQIPPDLRPLHRNVQEWDPDQPDQPFDDRFRVQVANRPATTITCHISKDGHYNVHYDPTQCRSLTVREAARIQTFPDNYFFEGPRTEQYRQVGNAVPPLLARQIAEVVYGLLERVNAAG